MGDDRQPAAPEVTAVPAGPSGEGAGSMPASSRRAPGASSPLPDVAAEAVVVGPAAAGVELEEPRPEGGEVEDPRPGAPGPEEGKVEEGEPGEGKVEGAGPEEVEPARRVQQSSLGFLAGWPAVGVVAGVVIVLVISSLVIGRSRPASTASEAPPPTSLVIGRPPTALGLETATQRCSNSADATAPLPDGDLKIGSSFAQSGTYASFGDISKGWQARLSAQNADGGVHGRKVTVITKDDKNDPATTKSNVRELIDEDRVFALFNVIGETNNLALRADLNKSCVPDLFAASGAPTMANPDRYPWLIGSLPAPGVESGAFASYLRRSKPEAKVGILRQNDEFGARYADSFKKAITGTGVTMVSEQIYDMGQGDVGSQISKMRASGADSLLLAVNAATCSGALGSVHAVKGWEPVIYLVTPCSTKLLLSIAGGSANGVITSMHEKDPRDPRWDSDDAMRRYKQQGLAQGLTEDELADPAVAYGWTMGDLLIHTLTSAPTLTREAVMKAAYALKGVSAGLLMPGITVNTDGEKDPYPIEQVVLGRWNGKYLEQLGDVVSFEGRSGRL